MEIINTYGDNAKEHNITVVNAVALVWEVAINYKLSK